MIRYAVRLLLLLPALALAQPTPDPLAWLNRMAGAAQTLDYGGTFVYQSGARSETSRILHVSEEGREIERLEVLDGSPRVVVRNHDEIRCYLPDAKRILVEKRIAGRSFPALIASDVKALASHYTLRSGGIERIAGHDAQLVALDAKDAWRYSHRLWAEINSGLILRAQILDERQRVVEQFSFTQLSIGGEIDRADLESPYSRSTAGWKTENLSVAEATPADSGWHLQGSVPGFSKIYEMRRRSPESGATVKHLVFSDGLAAVSVFIAPIDAESSPKPRDSGQGAINVRSRVVAGHVVTVLGEVPQATARKIANGIEYRKP